MNRLLRSTLITASATLLPACSGPAESDAREASQVTTTTPLTEIDPMTLGNPWSVEFKPPLALDTERLHLEPLAPRHVQLDFAALMGSREHLQNTLRWGTWPREDFTVEENGVDLQRHWAEFEAGEGYAYTVLSADRSRCLGCVYLEKPPGGETNDAVLAYWVIEAELATDLDSHLLDSLLDWFQTRWPLEHVALLNHVANARGETLATAAGLTVDDGRFVELSRARPDETVFVWKRDALER